MFCTRTILRKTNLTKIFNRSKKSAERREMAGLLCRSQKNKSNFHKNSLRIPDFSMRNRHPA